MLISGGFDPVHVGHLRLIKGAAVYGRVVVALNSDEWLYRKKNYYFMPWEERAEILQGFGCEVIQVDDADGTVCDALRRVRPTYFANGGDRLTANQAEDLICRTHNIEQLFGVGGGKTQSSSALVNNLFQRMHK